MEWTELPSNVGPRRFHSIAYYPPHNSLLLFGGTSQDVEILQEYDIATNKWRRLSCAGVTKWDIKAHREAFVMALVTLLSQFVAKSR